MKVLLGLVLLGGVAHAEAWPPWLVIATSTRLADGHGELAERVHVELVSMDAKRAKIHVVGPLELWEEVGSDQLGVLVCKAGALPSQPVHLDVGDLVALRGGIADGNVPVRAVVVPHYGATPMTYDGTLPVASLCTHDTQHVETGNAVSTVPKRSIAVLDRPGGRTLYTLRADEFGFVLHLLEKKRGFSRVLVGPGPTLDGWVANTSYEDGAGGFGYGNHATVPDAIGLGWTGKAQRLVHVASGTEVRSGAQRIAVLHQGGYARVLADKDDRTEVMIAVDNDATVRGTVATSALGAVVTDVASGK